MFANSNMAKPIFIFGIPNTIPSTEFERVADMIKRDITDYHVLVLRNTDDKYVAKIYSENGAETFDIKDVEKLLKGKL